MGSGSECTYRRTVSVTKITLPKCVPHRSQPTTGTAVFTSSKFEPRTRYLGVWGFLYKLTSSRSYLVRLTLATDCGRYAVIQRESGMVEKCHSVQGVH